MLVSVRALSFHAVSPSVLSENAVYLLYLYLYFTIHHLSTGTVAILGDTSMNEHDNGGYNIHTVIGDLPTTRSGYSRGAGVVLI